MSYHVRNLLHLDSSVEEKTGEPARAAIDDGTSATQGHQRTSVVSKEKMLTQLNYVAETTGIRVGKSVCVRVCVDGVGGRHWAGA